KRISFLSKTILVGCLSSLALLSGQTPSGADLAKSLGIEFPSGSTTQVILQRDGKRYLVDVAGKSVSELGGGTQTPSNAPNASAVFAKNCAACHGADGKGNPAIGTPNFHDPSFQRSQADADFSN